jgi:hypothetical protein
MRAKSFRQMSGAGILLFSTFLSTNTLAQGVVWFDNRPAYLPSPPDRRVLMPDGTPITGPAPGSTVSPFYAQLVYRDRTGTWVAHPTVARFFTSSANAGFWNGGSRTLVNAGSPAAGIVEPVVMQVRVWDGGVGTATQPAYSFDQARAQGRPWAVSPDFCYTEEWHTPRQYDDTYMKSFQGIPGPLPAAPPALQFSAASRAGDEFRFHVRDSHGLPYWRVILETKTDLSNSEPWIPVHTNLVPFWFTNSAPSAGRQRFYRAVFPPGPCPP